MTDATGFAPRLSEGRSSPMARENGSGHRYGELQPSNHHMPPAMLARPATVYANIAEANAILAGVFDDTKAAAAAFVEQGAKAALVTDGARPAAFADSEQVVTAAPPPVIVGTVTGAGDALVAGHIAAQISGRSPWDALAAGLRAAADAISKQRQGR